MNDVAVGPSRPGSRAAIVCLSVLLLCGCPAMATHSIQNRSTEAVVLLYSPGHEASIATGTTAELRWGDARCLRLRADGEPRDFRLMSAPDRYFDRSGLPLRARVVYTVDGEVLLQLPASDASPFKLPRGCD